MNRPEWSLIAVGCVACIINGGIQPVFGIILSKLTAVDFFLFYSNLHIKMLILLQRFFKNVIKKFRNIEFCSMYFYLSVLVL